MISSSSTHTHARALVVNNPSYWACGVIFCKSKHSYSIINTAEGKASRNYSSLMNIPSTDHDAAEAGDGQKWWKANEWKPKFQFLQKLWATRLAAALIIVE